VVNKQPSKITEKKERRGKPTQISSSLYQKSTPATRGVRKKTQKGHGREGDCQKVPSLSKRRMKREMDMKQPKALQSLTVNTTRGDVVIFGGVYNRSGCGTEGESGVD